MPDGSFGAMDHTSIIANTMSRIAFQRKTWLDSRSGALDLLHPTKAKTNPNMSRQNPDRHPTTTRTMTPRRPILSSFVLLQMLLMVHLMVVSLLLSGGRVVRAFSAPTTTTAIAATTTTAATTTAAWFPRTIQATIPYGERVKSLFLRHIVTETRDMGVEAQRLVLSAYTTTTSTTTASPAGPNELDQKKRFSVTAVAVGRDKNNDYDEDDPFGTIARSISACTFTRDEGGRIGWIDSLSTAGTTSSGGGMILPPLLIEELYRRQPKAGDMELLYDPLSDRWHLIQVSEVWLHRPVFAMALSSTSSSSSTTTTDPELAKEKNAAAARVGSFTGMNLLASNPRQLKGRGVRPTFTLNDLVTYDIQTAGCQMNVADSERGTYGYINFSCCFWRCCAYLTHTVPFSFIAFLLTFSYIQAVEGILQHQLSLTRTTTKSHGGGGAAADYNNMPDVLVLNTCSIRDHAEQKLYDTLGPYAAAKRQGRQMAVIVTGCVAQQEGEKLLRRIPEIDAVVGTFPYRRCILSLFRSLSSP
jgi:hypothetical protein